jgi:hypothetical protein
MKDKAVRVASVERVGTLFAGNKAGVIGQDGSYSVPLSDGSVFWSFGDTLIGPGREGYDPSEELLDDWLTKNEYARTNVRMLSNTAGISRSAVASLLPDIAYLPSGGIAGEPIPPDAQRRRSGGRYRPFWPMDGICIEGRLYLFYILVDCGTEAKPGEVDINVYGTGIATALAPWTKLERLEPDISVRPPSDPENSPEAPFCFWNNERNADGAQIPDFGVAALKRIIDGFAYIYGSRVATQGGLVKHEVCVARAPTGTFERLSTWRYFDGQGWRADPASSACVFSGNSNELSVAWNPYLGRYVSFYGYAGDNYRAGSRQAGAMAQLRMRSSAAPEGPWSEEMLVCELPLSIPADYCYAGKEHPEYQEEGGKVTYVTFVSHQRYFPELLKIEFD